MGYDYIENMIIGLGVLVIGLACIIAVISYYLLYAIPTYLFLRDTGYDKAWLVFIPFCYNYAVVMSGEDGSGSVKVFGDIIMSRHSIGLLSCFIYLVNFIPIIRGIGFLIILIFDLGVLAPALTDFFARYDGVSKEQVKTFSLFASVMKIIVLAKIFQYRHNQKYGLPVGHYFMFDHMNNPFGNQQQQGYEQMQNQSYQQQNYEQSYQQPSYQNGAFEEQYGFIKVK